MRLDKEYLKLLLKKELAETFDFSDIDVTDSEILYLVTQKHPWLGLREGIDSQADIKAKCSKFSKIIRSNCSLYNKFFYKEGKLIKVETYIAGHDRLAVWYKVFYAGNKRYICPYGTDGKYVWGYIFVTEYKDKSIW